MIKLRNAISGLRDDISFWGRKDVSLRFKILNMLSGDRLRIGIAFPSMAADQLKEDWAEIFDPRYGINWDNPSKDDIDLIVSHYRNLEWRINDISNDLKDLWEI